MDRELMMLAAKVVAADQKKLAAAIEEVISIKRILDGIDGGMIYTPDYVFVSGEFSANKSESKGSQHE